MAERNSMREARGSTSKRALEGECEEADATPHKRSKVEESEQEAVQPASSSAARGLSIDFTGDTKCEMEAWKFLEETAPTLASLSKEDKFRYGEWCLQEFPRLHLTLGVVSEVDGCTDTVPGEETAIYYVKPYQDAPGKHSGGSSSRVRRNPDVREPYLYFLLHALDLGGEPHIFFPTEPLPRGQRMLYIATAEVPRLLLLSKVTRIPEATLIQFQLSKCLFRMGDLSSNNCGCLETDLSKIKIVDFQIRDSGFPDPGIVESFTGDDNDDIPEFGVSHRPPGWPRGWGRRKWRIARESLEEWGLVEKLDQARNKLFEHLGSRVPPGTYKVEIAEKYSPTEDELDEYIENVKENVARLQKGIAENE